MTTTKKAQVLIVDDYPTNIKVLSDLLIEYGFEVLIARDGENALQKLQRILPDIILLDILMPGIDGFETCRQLKAQALTQDIPVIFMTALSDPVDKIKGLTMGAVDYITKPFQQEEVLARVNTHLKIRQLSKCLAEQNAQLQEEARSRLLAESALRRSEEKFATAFRANPGPMMILSLEEGRFLDVNQSFCQVLGYPPEAVLGKTPRELNLMCDVDICDRILADLRSHSSVPKQDCQVYTQSGDIKTLMVAAERMPVKDSPCVLAMAWDVTECRRATTALQQAKALAEQANQAKSHFLAYISHELRTPLSNILGYAQLMDRRSTWDSDQQSYLNIINHSGEHLLQLINDVLVIAKIEAREITLHKTDVDLPELLTSLYNMLQPKALEKNLTFTCQLTPGLPHRIYTDATKLRQILINLVNNGLKFTEAGWVTLTVSLQAAPYPPDSLIFKVEDTGPGIAADGLTTIFEPFRQTEPEGDSSEGTGLGLTISRQFAQLLGGDLSVSSTVGQGSTFIFELPITPPQSSIEPIPTPQTKLPTYVVGIAPGQPQYRILVAEDQPAYRQLLVDLLTAVGFEVKAAVNGQEAVNLFQTWSPHLIWMDVQMPVLNGDEATRQIRAMQVPEAANCLPYSPGEPAIIHRDGDQNAVRGKQPAARTLSQPVLPIIIALTANAFDTEQSPVSSTMYNDIVLKPIPEEILFTKISQHLGVRYRYQQLVKDSTPTDPLPTSEPLAFAISEATRDSLWEMVGGNQAFLISYLTDSLEELPGLMQSLQKAMANQDIQALILAAHSIKGMGMTLGATHLVNLCQTLESQAETNLSMESLQIQEIEQALDRVLAALRREIS